MGLGQSVQVPIALVVVSFILGVALIVNSNVFSILDAMDLGTEGNETRTSLEANTWSAYDLTALLPIVLGASAVITVLVGAFIYLFQRGSG